MMRITRLPSRWYLAALTAAAAAMITPLLAAPEALGAPAVSLPPVHAGFDYQIGQAYTPPAGVRVVTRDHEAPPATGLYNICYINAFQVQPGAEGQWDADLLLRDGSGKVVYDDGWGEALLDLRTADKRQRVAAKVGGWIDGCANKGFQGVEPDNYDSYTRSRGLLSSGAAKSYITLLAERSHSRGLAIAQKNTSELAGSRAQIGLDFAVAEECGAYSECGDYTAAFGSNVIVIEYTKKGLSKACASWGGQLSIVRRDVNVSPAGSSGYVRQTC
ncbi:endo alpha-1,4 polygalactosaminidase [Streptomyces sp. SID13588]|nr:endo alpha-1,4 polygalactosaminidase [Streptomyces sp. SID13588]